MVSDLLDPLAEAMYRDESVGELYRQLDPADMLFDYLIGNTIGLFGSGANIATGRNAEANRTLKELDANEAAYLRRMEEIGHLRPEGKENAALDGAAEEQFDYPLSEQISNRLQNKDDNDIILDTRTKREKVLFRAHRITSIDDLSKVSKSPVINMKSYDVILQHFSQTHRVNVQNFEGRDLLSVKAALAGYDDMLREFPDIMGHIHTIRYDPRIRALGQMGQGGLSLVGVKGLKDYGTGVHEAAHALDFARSKGGKKYSETVLAEARRRLGLRVNSREYKDLCFISTMDVKEMVKPEEVFAYAIETEKGGTSNRLSKVIWEIITEES